MDDIFVVEQQYTYLTLNNKPVWSFDYHFFLDKIEAQKQAKIFRKSLPNTACKVRTSKLNTSFFDWHKIYPHISNDKTYYSLTFITSKVNPTYGEKIRKDVQFSEEIGIEMKARLDILF
jgi:hypothetical protein